MSDLVDSRQLNPSRVWARRVGVAAAVLGLVAIIIWVVVRLSHQSTGPKRQVAKIALLPDTPPPPPPPPPEKPKIEPKVETKQQQMEKKQDTPPEPQVVKMEGAAGDGPSPFAAGEVKNDYIGGDIGNGEVFNRYVERVAQYLQEQFTKCKVKVPSAQLLLWTAADGAVQRFRVRGAPPDVDRQINGCMAEVHTFPDAPPQGMPVPFGVEISSR